MSSKRAPQHPKSVWDEKLLVEALDRHNVKKTHTKTIWRLLLQNEGDFTCLGDSSVPQRVLPILQSEFTYCSSKVKRLEQSALDGTIKLLIKLQDGCEVEAVIINHTGEEIHGVAVETRTGQEVKDNTDRVDLRKTLCVSSQVGCKLGCTFCATGTMKLEGNVYAGEIMEQALLADHVLNFLAMRQKVGGSAFVKPEEMQEVVDRINSTRTCWRGQHISNIVFMGMGEPLQNFDNVLDALHGLTDPTRFSLAMRNLTVSTVGIVDRMRELMVKVPNVKLALSLHAPNQKLREQIVPVSRNYHIDSLMAELDGYAARHATDGKRKGLVLVAYIMIDGVNDTEENLQELIQLLKGRQVTINLIPFNSFDPYSAGDGIRPNKKHPAEDYQTSKAETIDRWLNQLQANDIRVYERRPHGRDISAACGQLAKINRSDATALESVNACDIEDGYLENVNRVIPLSRAVVQKNQRKKDMERRRHMQQVLIAAGGLAGLTVAGAWLLRRRR